MIITAVGSNVTPVFVGLVFTQRQIGVPDTQQSLRTTPCQLWGLKGLREESDVDKPEIDILV